VSDFSSHELERRAGRAAGLLALAFLVLAGAMLLAGMMAAGRRR